jgi:hypothetical protein
LDQEIRAVRVIRIWLGLERDLVVVAIAEDGSEYVVGATTNRSIATWSAISRPSFIAYEPGAEQKRRLVP